MNKIICLINIEEKGVHALFCRLGFHKWLREEQSFRAIDGNWYYSSCVYCPTYKNKQLHTLSEEKSG